MASILWLSAFFIVQLSHPCVTTGKIIALTIWTFVGKVTSLLFNTLSRFVIAFLLRSKHLLISSGLSLPSTVILKHKKIKSVTVSILYSIYLPWSDGTGCHDLHFLKLSFKSVRDSFSGQVTTVTPLAWQRNKAILFYFTQNFVFEIQFGMGAQRPSFLHQCY